jgi:hypothetical protein
LLCVTYENGFASFLALPEIIMDHRSDYSHGPDFSHGKESQLSRRGFVQSVSVAAVAAATVVPSRGFADETVKPVPESLVTKLFNTLSPAQKEEICFDWDHKDDRGLLRMHVSNNWQITGDHKIASGFYTKDQQDMIEALLRFLVNRGQGSLSS